MDQVYEKLIKCAEIVKKKADFVPEAALVLGSGLGEYANLGSCPQGPYFYCRQPGFW